MNRTIKIILLLVLVVLCVVVYPFAFFTPEQRSLRRACTVGKVCSVGDDVVNSDFTPHEKKIAHMIYEIPPSDEMLADFDAMFDDTTWKIVRKKRRTDREATLGPPVYPTKIEFWRMDEHMWTKTLAQQVPEEDVIVDEQKGDRRRVQGMLGDVPRLIHDIERDRRDVDDSGDAPEEIGPSEEAHPEVEVDGEGQGADAAEHAELLPRVAVDEQVEDAIECHDGVVNPGGLRQNIVVPDQTVAVEGTVRHD